MEKQQLREKVLLQRQQLSKSDFWRLNDELLTKLQQFNWSRVKVLHLFLPIVERKEVDTFEFINYFKTEQAHMKLAVPRCHYKTRQMDAVLFDPETTVLAKNKHQIPEPLYGELLEPQQIDAVIIPLLTFDLLGHRVGYGGGFYDRFLERCRPDVLKIGVSLFEPIEKIFNTHEQDVLLSHCITPTHTYFFGNLN
ncbi:5-formyltetrahydrofolate cyclo-ligase [Pelobium manganitolerans]|uniref:5-formyltetrahydrofolate cyclo-ligase n=1 Tax=Pelobium manganitolerans TaxID=1842495 RepID=A0A419SBX6_9SPHI|nr:5-formyltetrahydrofolate cyclo-ligase [Pelobium manganitolerans]RKD20334.1 5-formyltetrahydrofolate cyclo-ligase [Pelobium manganitolerans]